MFLSKDEIINKVTEIIHDDIDNDIVFIVANKGIGKLKILRTIYDKEIFDKTIIFANGRRIKNACSILTKCYIDGIYSYLERNNSYRLRSKFINTISKYNLKCSKLLFTYKRKISIDTITEILSELKLVQLKYIYYEIARNTPLVLFVEAMTISQADMDYLLQIKDDIWNTKITFVIATRANPENLKIIHKVSSIREHGVWVFPLLPDIIQKSNKDQPKSLASISVSDVGCSSHFIKFKETLLSNDVYFEMYTLVQQLLNIGFQPEHLFILANQEISINSHFYLQKVINKIYPKHNSAYNDKLILPYDGRLLWVDALSYYLALYEGVDKAITETQKFFFDVIINAKRFNYGEPERNAFSVFLKDAAQKKDNQLADGFATYFSSFAALASIFFPCKRCENSLYKNMLIAVQILDRVMLEYSSSSIKALETLYDKTQMCAFLDVGLKTIIQFISNSDILLVDESCIHHIEYFQKICLFVAYKWNDVTLIDEIVALQKCIRSKGKFIKIKLNYLDVNEIMMFIDNEEYNSQFYIYEYLVNKLKAEDILIGEMIMKNTIFLSYTHNDSKIADAVEISLTNLGYKVSRDIKNIAFGDSLKDYMKSIRAHDYVVLLVSDTYLHKENCMYEIAELLRDENYIDRTFPIAVNFSEEEKNTRKQNQQSTSMFTASYWVEIVIYWQEVANKLQQQIDKLSRENSAELDAQYRVIKNYAQNVSEFLSATFNERLLGVIEQNNPEIKKLIEQINDLIQKNEIRRDVDSVPNH